MNINYTFVYTNLKINRDIPFNKIIDLENNEIKILKRKLMNNIVYGQHHRNNMPIYQGYINGINEFFVYYISDRKKKHPDQNHSYDKNSFKYLLDELNNIYKDIKIK